MNRTAGIVLWGVAVLAVTNSVRADVREPAKIRMNRDTLQPAKPGEPYSSMLEVIAPKDAVIERIEIGGDGWQSLSASLSTPIPIVGREALQVPFQALALDPSKKLEVRVTVDGEVTLRRFGLSAEHLAQMGRPRPTIRVGQTDPVDAPRGGGEGGIAGCDDQEIRIRGRFEYVRFDGQEIGADGVRFKVMDQDAGPDEVMFESYTDTNGYFDVTICWDDCDAFGCDDPDIYLYFDCETGVAVVRNDDVGEDTYAWSTEDSQIYGDYQGHDLNFGDIRPANAAEYTAVHIHNSVMRAHRFVLENNGYYTPQTTVVWQDGNGAFYRPGDNEVHIGPDEQWNEGTQVHEWGHHLLYDWTSPLNTDYCNGFCDDPAVNNCGAEACMNNGGHCVWCAETDHDAWNEGFPDWLGSVVMRSWQARYGGVAPSAINDGRYTLEATGNCCDGTAHNALNAEGFVGALLRDIDDPFQDPGQTSCPQDSLSLGSDEILAVVRQSRPVRVTEFINAFRAAYLQYEQDFRSTAQAVAPAYVAGWPIPTIQVQSTSGCGAIGLGDPITLHVQTNASRYSTCMRWQRDGVDVPDGGRISGAMTDTLTITNAQPGDAGRYTLIIRSCDGTPNVCDANASQSLTSPTIQVRVFGGAGAGHRITGWGRNLNGSLGRGSTMPDADANPADVINLTNAVAVSAGYWNSIALLADGTAWVWGFRYLGDGTSNSSATPVQVHNLTDVVAVAAGSPEGNCLALDADGHVWSWGSNYQGLLGFPQPSGVALNPGQVNLECVVDISIGNYHAAAVTSDGSLWIWGTNTNGELGLGTTGGASNLPVRVTDLSNVVDVECGGSYTLALLADGTLWGCGWNVYGQLGDGTFTNRNRFVRVTGLANVTSMSAGQFHGLARLANGQAWAWGSNGSQELGTGSPLGNVPTPAPVINVGSVRAVEAGYQLSLFVAADGTIWSGGTNYAFGLGRPYDGTTAGLLPAPVDTRVGAALIASAGANFVMTIAPGARIIAPVADKLVAGCSAAQLSVSAVGEAPINYQWGRVVGGLFVPLNELGGRITGTTTPTLTISPTDSLDTDTYRVLVANSTNTVNSNLVRLETPPPVNRFDTPQDAARFGNERGNWAITNGAYAAGAPALYANSAYSSFNLPQSDFLIELDVVNASHLNFDTNGGIYLRSSFSTALPYPRGVVLAFGEAFPFGAGDVYWHRNYGSGYQSGQNIAQSVYTAGQTLHLRIEVRGDTYTCWANDALTPTTTLTTPDFPVGKVALLDGVANGTSFDNIYIQSLTNCASGSGNDPVRILQRPQSQSVQAGALVTLSVAATGTGPLSYQWLRGGSCISGANSPTLSFTASAGVAGRYECTVTNACGAVGSYPATITVTGAGAGRGDLNCDARFDNFDIDAFVLAVSSEAAYQAAYPNCPRSNADVNGDGNVDNFDIDPFVLCLTNGACP